MEAFRAGEGLVGEVTGFQAMPDNFDVVEFGRVFWQPFDGEPVLPGHGRCLARLADVDGALSRTRTAGFPVRPGRGRKGHQDAPAVR